MCKAANESDLLVVVHTYYTNRFSRMNLLNMAKGPFFWPPSFALSLSKAEFFLDIGLRSVGDVTHSDHREKGRQNSPAFVRPQAASSNSPSIIIIREETEPPTVVAQVKAGTLELLRRLEPDVNRLSRRHFPYLSNWRRRGSP